MRLLCALFEMIMVGVIYYILLSGIQRKCDVGIEIKNYIIKDRLVYWVGGLLCIITFYLCYIKYLNMHFLMHLMALIITVSLAVITILDIRKQWVPNFAILLLLGIWAFLFGACALVELRTCVSLLGTSIIGGIVAGAIFLLCYFLSKRQLGAGDVKLVFAMGLYLTGNRIMGAILYGTIFCCIYSVVQLLRKKIGTKDAVPLVPFLFLGTIFTFCIL